MKNLLVIIQIIFKGHAFRYDATRRMSLYFIPLHPSSLSLSLCFSYCLYPLWKKRTAVPLRNRITNGKHSMQKKKKITEIRKITDYMFQNKSLFRERVFDENRHQRRSIRFFYGTLCIINKKKSITGTMAQAASPKVIEREETITERRDEKKRIECCFERSIESPISRRCRTRGD